MCGRDSATSERHHWKFKMSELFIGLKFDIFKELLLN